MRKVPFVDLKAQYQSIKPKMDAAIQDVINNTAFIGGKVVSDFEQSFADLYGMKHCVSVANGTDSLYIIMKMLGIGPGDEVITVANSWISTSETISQTGAKPVFVDIDEYATLNVNLLSEKITSKTKMIIPVHLYGQMCNMDPIMELAKKHNLYIMEDCAQAHFAEYKGKRAGTIGVASSFSFYPGKNLGAYGDAGCILTNNDELAEKCRMYARHGALVKHDHKIEGINSRLDGLQAAILTTKLPYILEWTAMRKSRAALYDKLLADVPVDTPKVREVGGHVYHLYVIRTKQRDELQQFLSNAGIDTAVHYPVALPNMPAYEYLGTKQTDYPEATVAAEEILSLPIYPELSDEDVEYVCSEIKVFFQELD